MGNIIYIGAQNCAEAGEANMYLLASLAVPLAFVFLAFILRGNIWLLLSGAFLCGLFFGHVQNNYGTVYTLPLIFGGAISVIKVVVTIYVKRRIEV